MTEKDLRDEIFDTIRYYVPGEDGQMAIDSATRVLNEYFDGDAWLLDLRPNKLSAELIGIIDFYCPIDSDAIEAEKDITKAVNKFFDGIRSNIAELARETFASLEG